MTRRKLLQWTLPASFLLLCALTLFFFSRYAKSDDEVVALTPTLDDALDWDICTWEDGEPQPFPTGEVAQSAQTISPGG